MTEAWAGQAANAAPVTRLHRQRELSVRGTPALLSAASQLMEQQKQQSEEQQQQEQEKQSILKFLCVVGCKAADSEAPADRPKAMKKKC